MSKGAVFVFVFAHSQKTMGVWAHNPSAVVAPDHDHTLLLFHIGAGNESGKQDPERTSSRQSNQTCRGGNSPCGMHKRHLCNGSRPDFSDDGGANHVQTASHDAQLRDPSTAAGVAPSGAGRGGGGAGGGGSTISFLTAREPSGPWQTFEAAVMYPNGTALHTSGNNPAPWIHPNGTIFVAFHGGLMVRAERWQGPYVWVTDGGCGATGEVRLEYIAIKAGAVVSQSVSCQKRSDTVARPRAN